MKCCRYTDGTFSREIENDWEATGQEEMNRLHEECKQNKRKGYHFSTTYPSITNVQDRLNNLKDLVALTTDALLDSDRLDSHSLCAQVLLFHVMEQINIAERELSQV